MRNALFARMNTLDNIQKRRWWIASNEKMFLVQSDLKSESINSGVSQTWKRNRRLHQKIGGENRDKPEAKVAALLEGASVCSTQMDKSNGLRKRKYMSNLERNPLEKIMEDLWTGLNKTDIRGFSFNKNSKIQNNWFRSVMESSVLLWKMMCNHS